MNHIHTIGMNHGTTVYVNSMMTVAVYGCPATALGKSALLKTIQAFGNIKMANDLDDEERAAKRVAKSEWSIASSIVGPVMWVAAECV